MKLHGEPFINVYTCLIARQTVASSWMRLLAAIALFAIAEFAGTTLHSQTVNEIAQQLDAARVQALPNHHPQWANSDNSVGLVSSELPIEQLTLVLSRSPERETAFEQFLSDQQNPASPDYHHWLTPAEVGERFGLSNEDLATITGWIQSQGLHVNWVAPSRMFIGFGGTASGVSGAFETELRNYKVNGLELMSVSSDPKIPQALAPAIKAIRGLYSINDRPAHYAVPQVSASPALTTGSGRHYIVPMDFQFIYDVPLSYSGYKQTIGIVGGSRTDFADFDNFRQKTMSFFQTPTEVIPTAFGGVDPGPALTAPPSNGASIEAQGEATLDVTRAGSIAPNANLVLVVATSSSGGIAADAQYLVQTTPVPAQVMSISYGACESAAGSTGVYFWDTLFQQAAAEGISVFVASGDSGAAGCDPAFGPPPATFVANSPNYICSSSYATCVGGTEFNDFSTPSLYWLSSTGNGTSLSSALGYIPEGGWNEPLNSGSIPQVAASGGGVSSVIPTPLWQTGAGVPVSRSGRYTPDVSFSSSCHDGYFGCFAAGGGSCVSDANGSFGFIGFCGTSVAAPSLAGVTALLDEKFGRGVGNLNPGLYQIAASAPAAFHDTTVATSGVSTCDVNSPSMCNNSIPSPNGLSGGEAGYLVTDGFDEVTGLGSLDLQKFFDNFTTPTVAPTVTVVLSPTSITTAQPLTATVSVNSAKDTIRPAGSLTVTTANYTSATLAAPNATFQIPAGVLPAGTDTITANYSPDSSVSSIYSTASGANTVTVTAVPKITPTMTVSLSSTIITTAQQLIVTVGLDAGSGNGAPTGTVSISSGTYSSAPAALNNGGTLITILANSLPLGIDTLTVTYVPDKTSSSIYNSASAMSSVTVSAVEKITPTITLQVPSYNVPINESFGVLVTVSAGTGNQTPTGTVTLTSGSFNSSFTLPANASGWFNLAAGSLPVGVNALTVNYMPDATSVSIYNSASGSQSLTVVKVTPVIGMSLIPSAMTAAQALTVQIDVLNETGNQLPVPSGTVTLTSGGYRSPAITLVLAQATFVVPPGVFPIGTDTLTVTYTPDAECSSTLASTSQSSTVTITGVATPTVTVIPSLSSFMNTFSLPVSISVSWGASNPTPTGTVALSGGGYTSPPATLAAGSATITIPGGSLIAGIYSLTATYTPDAASASIYGSATGSSSVMVTAPAPSFTIAGTAVSIQRGASVGNTSTITITPSGGFVGGVTLSASITSSPTGAQLPPTFSFGSTSPASITSANAATATLAISTTAATSSGLEYPAHPGSRWYSTCGAALAGILLLSIRARRRRWQTTLGILVLVFSITCGVFACGGGSSDSSGGGGGGGANSGTTAGTYTITVTGTSGAITQTGAVSLTVR